MTQTHYVLWDAPGTRLSRALCGALVDRRRDHANEPTCAACAHEQARREAMEIGDDTPEARNARHREELLADDESPLAAGWRRQQ